MMNRRVNPNIVAGALCVFLGCGGTADGSSHGISVDTSASGVLTVRVDGVGLWGAEPDFRLVVSQRLGNEDQGDAATFGQVWSIERDAGGRIYVLDRLAKAIQVFDRSGGYVRTLGRPGGGPGEFENPFGLTWAPDGNLWIVDVRLRRYSVFDTAGTPIGEYRRQVGGYSWPWPGRFTADGVLLEPDLRAEHDDVLVGFLPGATLQPIDTFPDPAVNLVPSAFWNLQDERGLGAVVAIPFGPRGYRSLTDDGHVWTGHGATYVLVKQTLEGDTVLIVEHLAEVAAVSDAERDEAVEQLGDFVDHPKMDLALMPTAKPFFRDVTTDETGRLWVLREGSGDEWFYDVYNTEGWFLGMLTLPVKPEVLPPPRVYSDEIVLVTRDDLDVQYVVILTMSSR